MWLKVCTVRWGPVGGGCHSGQSIERRRVTPRPKRCRERRCGSPGSQAPQRAHISRVGVPRARAQLVVWAGDVGGRWSGETLTCLRLLVEAKSRSEPPLFRRRAEMAWRLRWTHMLSCAAARAFACSLLERRLNGGSEW